MSFPPLQGKYADAGEDGFATAWVAVASDQLPDGELTRGHIWTGRSLWADGDPFDDELEHELKPLIPAPLED